jgi:hypothetical protein
MYPDPQEVMEFQGLYGPFSVPEKLLQKIWLRGDFSRTEAQTVDGRPVDVLFPGKWNLLGGPDFRGAHLRLGEVEVRGDVELHFHAADWMKHRHHLDPAYDNVVLHVLLFRPGAGSETPRTSQGVPLPALPLLDLLHHDLEEYAAEDALEATLERSHWQTTERLLALPLHERRELLVVHARRRWKQKVHFAQIRLKKLGWSEACHGVALEILGYRRNRAPMLNVALRYPLAAWATLAPAESSLLAAGGSWQVQGSRPANRPGERLRQYALWLENRPDWPDRLLSLASASSFGRVSDGAVVALRKKFRLRAMREVWADELTGGEVAGPRLDTLICDGFLPLAAAAGGEDLFDLWFGWFAGDLPERVEQTLRAAEILDRRRHVPCNGLGQGVLSLSLEQRGDPLACIEEGEVAPGVPV